MAKKKTCKHCKEEIESNAKVCPKCGGKLGMPIWIIILIVVLVIAIISTIVIIGNKGTPEPKKEELILTEHRKSEKSDQYAMYIEGTVKNNREKPFSFAQVTFTTYDANGNKLGTCISITRSIEVGGTWEFSATCIDKPEAIDHYELTEIKGW